MNVKLSLKPLWFFTLLLLIGCNDEPASGRVTSEEVVVSVPTVVETVTAVPTLMPTAEPLNTPTFTPEATAVPTFTSTPIVPTSLPPTLPPPPTFPPTATPTPTATSEFHYLPQPPDCIATPENAYRFECEAFQLTPNEKWVYMHFGSTYCDGCQSTFFVNLETNETFSQGGEVVRFLPEERVILQTSPGEGAKWHLLDLTSQEVMTLGNTGRSYSLGSQNVILMEAYSYGGGYGSDSIWMFNYATNQYFRSRSAERERTSNTAVWAPDQRYVLYLNREILDRDFSTVTVGPKSVKLLDTAAGESQTLLSDPNFDFYLSCGTDDRTVCQWKGDWIRVVRIPYVEAAYYYEDYESYKCPRYGKDCEGESAVLYLNWRTGELKEFPE